MKTVLASLLALPLLGGCVVLQDAYDQAAVDACDAEIDARARLDCIDRAESVASEKQAERRASRNPWKQSNGTDLFDSGSVPLGRDGGEDDQTPVGGTIYD